ncbi:hypothetical protein VTN00DRAFT_3037 [Thermoascus crustaceus]|uniref:uncharacterized protein n=1 Tax=Thermoascus crustaceus TaxID=5088 RepID=UPI0037442AED
MLAPVNKFKFFLTKDWDQKWRDTYRKSFQQVLIPYQEQLSTLNQSSDGSHSAARPSSKLDKMLDESEAQPKAATDKMTQYLDSDTIHIAPLAFWREHQARFPAIAALARDVLSFPATGAGVERLFNTARDVCHYRRGRMKSQTIEELMMFLCTSRFDIEEQEAKLLEKFFSHDKMEAAKEEKDEKLDKVEIDPISDTEEQDTIINDEMGLDEAGEAGEAAVTSAPQCLPQMLWDKAYDALKVEESKLVQAYEKILSRELNEDAPSAVTTDSQKNTIEQENAAKRQSQMRQLIQAGLKKTQREAQVKESIGEGMRVVNSVKDIISPAIRNVPEAALPWAGVILALQILTNPISEMKANQDGIDYVIKRMDWYWKLSSRILENSAANEGRFAGLRCELEKQIVDLYKVLLSYQMKSVCSYYRKRGLVLLRDLTMLDDWDGNFKSVKDAEDVFRQDSATYREEKIKSGVEQLVDMEKDKEMNAFRDLDNQCLRDLRLTDPRDDMERIEGTKDRLLRDSYVWIINHEDFTGWRDGDETQLLWIKGDPGKGKTMLLIGIVKEMQSTSESTLLSYFFCQATDKGLNSSTAVLRGLIYRLLVQQPSLMSHVRDRYAKAGQSLFADSNAYFSLSQILTNMLHDSSVPRVYLIVDALDECESGLSQLLDLISRTASASTARVKWLVSSRHKDAIEERLRSDKGRMKLSLELNAHSHVASAVTSYISHKVEELARLKSYGSELQVDLAETSRRKTLSVLQTFPPGLRPFYQRMMEQMRDMKDKEDLEICKRILAAVVLAYRPTHLDELDSIVGLPEKLSDDKESLEELVGLCGSFLTIREGFIYVVHQSAKDYLSIHAVPDIFPNGIQGGQLSRPAQLIQIPSLRFDMLASTG